MVAAVAPGFQEYLPRGSGGRRHLPETLRALLSSDPAQPAKARRPVAGCNPLPLPDLTSTRQSRQARHPLVISPTGAPRLASCNPLSRHDLTSSRHLVKPISRVRRHRPRRGGSDASTHHRVRYPCFSFSFFFSFSWQRRLDSPSCTLPAPDSLLPALFPKIPSPRGRRPAGVSRRVSPPVRGSRRY